MILHTVFDLVGFCTIVSIVVVPTSMLPGCLKIPVHLVVHMEL